MSSDEKSLDNPPDMQKIVISTFLDTTWRMFTPILVSILAGWLIDRFTGTRPVATLTGLAFGILITFLCSWLSVNKFLRMKASSLYKI